MIMDTERVPSSFVLSALAQYADLLAAHGPDSQESVQFFESHKHLKLFEDNARQLHQLEKEDYQERVLSRIPKSGQ
jgi:hypothetical protein